MQRKVYTEEDFRTAINETDPKAAFVMMLDLIYRSVLALEVIADASKPGALINMATGGEADGRTDGKPGPESN